MHIGHPRRRHSEVDVASVLKNLNRLEAVKNTRLIGRAPRADLDALTKEASDRLNASMAQVTLVEDHRQVFVNAFGKTGPLAEIKETSLENSYCKYVVAYNDVLVVEDAERDPLVRDSKSLAFGLRSYLGVPLRVNGEVVGSFCVFDNKPREWSLDDLNGLEEIAHEVMQHIDDQLEEDEFS